MAAKWIIKYNYQYKNDRALASGGNSGYESNQNRINRERLCLMENTLLFLLRSYLPQPNASINNGLSCGYFPTYCHAWMK